MDDEENQEIEATLEAGTSSYPEENDDDPDQWNLDDLDILNWEGFEVVDELEEFERGGDVSEEHATSEDEAGRCKSSEEDKESDGRYSRFKSHRSEGDCEEHDTTDIGESRKDKSQDREKNREKSCKTSSSNGRSSSKGKDFAHEEGSRNIFSRISHSKTNVCNMGCRWEDFPPPPTRDSATVKKVTCSSNWKFYKRVVILSDSRLKMTLPIMEPSFSKKIEVYNKSHLTLDDLVKFTKENVDLDTKDTTLMICSVGTYDIIKFEDAEVCRKLTDHEPIKEISLRNMDDVALVKELLQKMKQQKKNLQQLLGCDSEVYFTTIVPVNLVMFHDHQLKLHRKQTQHELEFKHSVDDLRQMQLIAEKVLQSLNKITIKNNLPTLPLNLFCYPRRLAREDHSKFYANSSDGIRFSKRFCNDVSTDLTMHIKKVLMKRSKYEKVVFVGDSRLEHVRKAWPEDVRYNCKIITDPNFSLGYLSNATDPIMKEICLCKNSLIVISLGIHDLCKLVQHDECDSHEKLEIFVPHHMESSSDIPYSDRIYYDMIKISVFMWRIVGNIKRLTVNCDLFFIPMYDFDLLSYQDYMMSLHKKATEHTIQKPIIRDDKKFAKIFSDTLSIMHNYNLICHYISQRYPFVLRNSPAWISEKAFYDGKIRRMSSSVLVDGIHPSQSLARDMADCFHNFADQALKIKFWIADKFVSPTRKDFYAILARCRGKVSLVTEKTVWDLQVKKPVKDVHNVKDSEDLGSKAFLGNKTRKSDKKEEITRSAKVPDPAQKETRSSDMSEKLVDSKLLESVSDISGSDSECISAKGRSFKSKHSGHHSAKLSSKSKESDVKHKSVREEEHGLIKGHGYPPPDSFRGNISRSFSGNGGSHSHSRSPVHIPRKYERSVSYPTQENFMEFRTLSEKRRDYSRLPLGRRSRSRSPFCDKYMMSSSRSRLLASRRSRSRSRSRSKSAENYVALSSRPLSPRRDQEEKALFSLREVHDRECEAYRKHPSAHPDYEKEFRKYRDKKMQCIIDLGGDPSTYDITKDWENFWSTRLKDLLAASWITKRDKCLKMLNQSKSKRNLSPASKTEVKIREQSQYSSSSRLKRRKSRSHSSSRERVSEKSFRDKEVKSKKRVSSPDSYTSSSDDELRNRPDGHREDSTDSDESNESEKAYGGKITHVKEEISRDFLETRMKREQEQIKLQYDEKEIEQKSLKSTIVGEQMFSKYKQKDLKHPDELRYPNVTESNFLTGLREKETTSHSKFIEDSFMRDIVAGAKSIPEPLLSLFSGKGNTEQQKVIKQSTQEVEPLLRSSGMFCRDESRINSFMKRTDEAPSQKTTLSGKYSLPSTSKEEPADEVTSTTPSFEVGKQEDLIEILEILTRLGDRLNVLKVPLKVVHDRALHYKSIGLDSTKLLDEKDAKTLLHLISSKLDKMIKDDSLNIIQKVIIQEANERLRNILKASGPDINTTLIAEKCLGKNEADTIAYIQSQFLEGGSFEVSHDQLKQIYAAVKLEKSRLLTQILKKSNVTTESPPKTTATAFIRDKERPPSCSVDDYSPHHQWSSEESQEVDTSYQNQLQKLKLEFASKRHENSPSERLLLDFPPRKSFEPFPSKREIEDLTSRTQIDNFLSKSHLEESQPKKHNEAYSSERYFSNEKSWSEFESISSKTQSQDFTSKKQLEDFSLRRHLDDFLKRKSMESAPVKEQYEERKVEDPTSKIAVEHFPSQMNFDEYHSRKEFKDLTTKRKSEDLVSNLPDKRFVTDFQGKKEYENLSSQKQSKEYFSEEKMSDFSSQKYSEDFRVYGFSTTNPKGKYEYPSSSGMSSFVAETSKERDSSSSSSSSSFYAQKDADDLSRFLPKTTGQVPDMASFISKHSSSNHDLTPKMQTQEKISSEDFPGSFLKNPIRLVIPKQQKQGSTLNPIRQSMDDSSW